MVFHDHLSFPALLHHRQEVIVEEDPMPEEHAPSDSDLENIKKAIVTAGFLKATSLDKEDEARVTKALAQHGVDIDPLTRNWKLICSRAHWCIVISKK